MRNLKLDAFHGIHHLSNLLTLKTDIQYQFDNFEAWFEGTDQVRFSSIDIHPTHSYHRHLSPPQPNTYVFQVLPGHAGSTALSGRQVTFTSDPLAPTVDVELPDPHLLRLHAVCVKVAHLSGVEENYFSKFSNELEETTVLSQDGSSMELLEYALESALH